MEKPSLPGTAVHRILANREHVREDSVRVLICRIQEFGKFCIERRRTLPEAQVRLHDGCESC